MDPHVSVILTSYNAEQFIRQAVDSILRQTYADFELLIIDDGSRDQTVSIIRSFHDRRIRIMQPGRVGRGCALNLGLQEAKGQLIAIQDADDFSHPCRLEVQVRLMTQNQNISVLGTGQWIISDPHTPVRIHALDTSDVRLKSVERLLIFINPISHTSLIVRRKALEEVAGYDQDRSNLFDWDLLMRLSERGYHPYKCSVPLVYKRIHEEQFFEKKRHLYYVKSCLILQWRSLPRLGRSLFLLVPLMGLFVYRLLPRWLRMTVRRCYGTLYLRRAQ